MRCNFQQLDYGRFVPRERRQKSLRLQGVTSKILKLIGMLFYQLQCFIKVGSSRGDVVTGPVREMVKDRNSINRGRYKHESAVVLVEMISTLCVKLRHLGEHLLKLGDGRDNPVDRHSQLCDVSQPDGNPPVGIQFEQRVFCLTSPLLVLKQVVHRRVHLPKLETDASQQSP